MHIKLRSFSKIPTESFLIGILYLIGLLSLYRDDDKKRGRPYVYPTTVMVRCFVVRIWFRIPSNNCLHHYFSIDTKYNKKIMRSCGLDSLPDRRTFDRRFKVLPIQDMIGVMGNMFASEKLADCRIVSVDSTLIHAANRRIWHKSDMVSNTMPRSGIDADARWGFARTKGWIFGYKIHMCCSTGKLVVPLSAGITTANIPDNAAYHNLVEPLPGSVLYVVADLGYHDHKLYDYSRYRGIQLVCPIRRFRHTKGIRLKMISFYKSRKGQRIYRNRSASIEPLIQCVKGAFGISSVPVTGFENVSSYLLMCVFVYQVAIYYNCMVGSDNPRCVRRMLGN
jgi:hypothetical protein